MYMTEQSSLGGRKINRTPNFGDLLFARVTSTKDFIKYGRIEVIFLDSSQPSPVWVVNDVDREPVIGDNVLVGYIEGKKDAPYLAGFVKNKNWSTNFVVVKKDKIKLQLPVYLFDTSGQFKKDSIGHKDVKGNLLDNQKQIQRATVELNPDELYIQMPFNTSRRPMKISMKRKGARGTAYNSGTEGEITISLPLNAKPDAYIKIDDNGFEFYHPSGNAVFKLPNGYMDIQ